MRMLNGDGNGSNNRLIRIPSHDVGKTVHPPVISGQSGKLIGTLPVRTKRFSGGLLDCLDGLEDSVSQRFAELLESALDGIEVRTIGR